MPANRKRKWAMCAAALCGAGSAGSALADNLLGFYAGVGVGESTVRSDTANYGYSSDYYFYRPDDRHHFAWKAMVGIRPISLLGAEVEYIDFGHPGSDGRGYYYDYPNFGPDSHPRAIAAFGVGHLPLPIPFIDIFGKVGAARLHTNVNGFDAAQCNVGYTCPQYVTTISQSRWDTRLAYGAGVQTRLPFGLSVRAEYERISSPYGDPDMFSVGATWTF